jgi:hypothetical protein
MPLKHILEASAGAPIVRDKAKRELIRFDSLFVSLTHSILGGFHLLLGQEALVQLSRNSRIR